MAESTVSQSNGTVTDAGLPAAGLVGEASAEPLGRELKPQILALNSPASKSAAVDQKTCVFTRAYALQIQFSLI